MTIETLVVKYGLLAILLGAGIEGEAVVVAGGVMAHRGLVPLVPACICAAIGSFVVDQIWFALGRRFQTHRWIVRIHEKPAFARALRLLERRPTAFILAFRFIYGMRTVSPIAIGTSKVALRTFLPLNALAAAVWGPVFTLFGYYVGHALDPLIDRIAGKAKLIVLVVVVLVVFVGVIQLTRHLLHKRDSQGDDSRS
ncbi:DedA family protein [Sphingomonas sp. AR_OL41]|uniref:DedA family protein n=1 Tax=Sphingomonas sp. AR_OL41 TaxID=3042729 RepID=UPI002480EE06|nr:DedA family protein [Sphingomonas sp. AR_OL41]MDH7975120.1 DedA family protein [Sphingomonas sp. AR_OL41]